ncbi:hypothetical protein [Protaetiibacter larvae]|uniref:DUF4209 domain-containing protein n=1 Tax=Protaetiibacter larvae TaxID=2592654 RepID=A0A5C1Y924_9MICO|nr:hypothetical protein [Protaetiibacter larvae]QEO09745.1 hypothetical protein FLP23_06840 [Protaetiibacter larvae]
MNDEAAPSDSTEDSPLYSEDDVAELAVTLDRLAGESNEPWDLLQRFTATFRTEGTRFERPPLGVMLERALAHGLQDDTEHPGGLVLGVRFSSPNGDWPPAFDAVGEVEKNAWSAVAGAVTDALPRAHLLDLSLSAGVRNGRDLGAEIAHLYLELGRRASLDPYYRGSCLRRAWSIARQFGLALEIDVRKALWVMAQSFEGIAETPAGILFNPLEPLSVAPRTGQFVEPSRQEVQALLDDALARPEAGATNMEAVAELRERLATDDSEREAARRGLVSGYLTLADQTDGFIKVHWLQTAAEKAQQYGLIDLRDRAVQALQEGSVDDLGMQVLTTEIVLPRHAHDGRLNWYRRSRDTRTALDIWLTSPSPTGRHDRNLQQAKELSRGGILQLVTRTVFNEEGLPVKTSTGPEAAEWEELERSETLNAGMYGTLLARELDAIQTEYGALAAADIAAHLVDRFACDAELAEALGEAFAAYWDGRYSDAGRAGYPLVEAGARGLLLALGDPLYRVQTGDAEGRFPALETYATKLEAHDFDIDWLRCLRNPVAGLRNVLAHGHRHYLVDHEAAVLLRMAALLVVLTPANASAEDRTQVAARVRDPLNWIGGRARLVKRWRRVWVPVPRRGSAATPS